MVIVALAAYFLFTSRVNNPIPGILFAAGVVVLAIFVRQRAHKLPFYRKLPIDRCAFDQEILERWRKLYGALPPGMLAPEQAPPAVNLPAAALNGALVCPDAQICAFLAANDVPIRLGLALLPAGPPFTALQETYLAGLRLQPELPLYVLHDASPAGCLLVGELRGLLGLDPQRELIDLGLNPRDVRQPQIVLGAPPDPNQIGQLRTSSTLQEEELAWLAAGQIAPLAGVPPKRLIALLERGLRQAGATPAAEAQQVGFMSWPAG